MTLQRREFITLLGGAAAWPLAARAQQRPAMPVIGYLVAGEQDIANVSPDFRKGLSEMGFVDGRNVSIEFRATNQSDRFPALATELVRRQVTVIYAGPPANGALAAKAATATIPIVFHNGADPVRLGLVASMNRPGGNITGVIDYVSALVAKRLEMLRELVPQATTIGFLTNPTNLTSAENTSELEVAARSVGQQIKVLKASTADEIDAAFATAAEQRLGALLVDSGALLFASRRDQLVALAARYRIPASYPNGFWVQAGGLMSYMDDRSETTRQAGVYVGRILKGDKPADLPVLQPTRFKLVVNLKAAKVIGLTIPETFLVRADEVIE